MNDTLIKVENVSKKFCRSLKRSLWYGMRDLGSELFGRSGAHNYLRKNEFWANKDISFTLKRGDTLGLIGGNGSGKTTLLRMLNGLVKPDTGRIDVRGRMQALIALGAGFSPILTGRENIYVNAAVLGIPKHEVDKRLEDIIDFSGIEKFIDTPVQSYSSGMTVRLGFAVAAHLNPDVLLVDEILAVGDEGFQSKCLNKIGELKKCGTAIILVSHNMHSISTFANRLILLDNGKHTPFSLVSEGIKAYRRLFVSNDKMDIKKVCQGNQDIKFYDAKINKQKLNPGETFSLRLKYESKLTYKNVEIDIAVYSSNEPGIHFQATNKAYSREIHLQHGHNELNIQIKNIMINNAVGTIAIAIWTENRTELVFWWRIPVDFCGVDHSTGNNFLNVTYELKKE